ncbi:MAG: outer membrane beta-barrel protein [Gammaproteobacteria bacterium]|nr:outer membrane beta-barrel protein [Gammaproteobacteria bacterium]
MRDMKPYRGVLAPLLLLGGANVAFAQMYPYPASPPMRPVQWYLDGGVSLTQGQTADDFDNGWTIGTGVLVRPDPRQPVALRFDVDYARSQATGRFISANEVATQTPIDHGTLQTVSGFFGPVLELPLSPWMRLYATGGVGVGYRRIELTQNGFFCDPFFCGSGSGRILVASSDSTHFAWNAGAGVDFALPGGQSWFIEARYERIETQGPTELVPIRFGIRF